MMAPILSLFIFYLVQYVLPSQCLFETSKFVKKDVCTNHFVKLDKPERKMLASICETQCMIVCHETEGCSISKCEGNSNCVLGRYVGFNYFDMDDYCTATEKMWVSYEAYQNRNSEERFSLVTDKGSCISKEGNPFAGCAAFGFESHNECGWSCIILGSCIAFNYRKETQRCKLITTSKPENGCPHVFTLAEGNVFAKSVDDLNVSESATSVCYARIKADKKELR